MSLEHSPAKAAGRLISDRGVADYLDVSRATVWRLLKEDLNFPRPIKIGGSTRWLTDEVTTYIAGLSEARRVQTDAPEAA